MQALSQDNHLLTLKSGKDLNQFKHLKGLSSKPPDSLHFTSENLGKLLLIDPFQRFNKLVALDLSFWGFTGRKRFFFNFMKGVSYSTLKFLRLQTYRMDISHLHLISGIKFFAFRDMHENPSGKEILRGQRIYQVAKLVRGNTELDFFFYGLRFPLVQVAKAHLKIVLAALEKQWNIRNSGISTQRRLIKMLNEEYLHLILDDQMNKFIVATEYELLLSKSMFSP